ncbi:MAG: ATP-binding cassette domain-containing protein [Pyramidobacter sp.]|nr:ATP-binding cassette domain-containing protein [Pyramidobacter sp.]
MSEHALNTTSEPKPVAEVRGLKKSFGRVEALRGVSLKIFAGEVLAIVGDNGSGKSTLISMISGAQPPDEGTVLVDGVPYSRLTAAQALSAGISAVYQDLSLDNFRDAAANIFLGNELTRWGFFLDRSKMRSICRQLLGELDISIPDITRPVGEYSGGQRQAVAVARAVLHGRRLVIFDEPTAAMGVRESAAVLKLIRQLARRGMAVVIICHNLHQVFDIADRVCVMRRGKIITSLCACDTTLNDVQQIIMDADSID